MNIRIDAETVIVETDDWIEAKSVDLKREGDHFVAVMCLADGRTIPYAEFTLLDNGAVSMPFTQGVVRVSKDVQD